MRIHAVTKDDELVQFSDGSVIVMSICDGFVGAPAVPAIVTVAYLEGVIRLVFAGDEAATVRHAVDPSNYAAPIGAKVYSRTGIVESPGAARRYAAKAPETT
jgi:hypothetical protein